MLGTKDPAHRTTDGSLIDNGIDGLIVRDQPAIITRNGVTTELFSSSWNLPTQSRAPRNLRHLEAIGDQRVASTRRADRSHRRGQRHD